MSRRNHQRPCNPKKISQDLAALAEMIRYCRMLRRDEIPELRCDYALEFDPETDEKIIKKQEAEYMGLPLVSNG